MIYRYTTTQQQEEQTSLEELLSLQQYTVLYFYPKDNTPGCTVEAQDFTRLLDSFTNKNVQVVGVSRDTHESHCNFMQQQGLTVALLSDPELVLHKQYGAWGEKNQYGKMITGVIRSTIILDQDGETIQSRHNVRAKGHAERVLKRVEQHI